MKKRKKIQFKPAKKQKGKAVTISLIISGILMTGLVVWIAMNDWNVEKSFGKLGFVDGQVEREKEDDTMSQPDVPEDEDIPDKEIELPIEDNPIVEKPDVAEKELALLDNGGYIKGQTLPLKPTYVKGILIANKKYPLPSTYAEGENLEARNAFDALAAKATLTGFNLTAFSTYRSFDYQKELYERYVSRDGEEAANRYSARPGYSEHQTGLAFDIGEINFEQHWASSTFGETEAGKWVAANAHLFGFIMRYPLGKEEVTGYMHESWHYRYIGKDIALEIYKRNITLEEYLEI